MKITPKQYAAALYEQIINKDAALITKIADNFLVVLAANGDLALAEKIVEELAVYWDAREDVLSAEVVTARPIDKQIYEEIKGYLSQITAIKNINLAQDIDSDLLGGAVIKYGDKVLDMSLKTRLNEMKQHLVK